MGNIDKSWLADIRKALHLCSDGIFDKYVAVSPILQASMISQRHQFHLFLEQDNVLSLRRMFWLFGCVAKLNELGRTPEGEVSGEKERGSAARRM